MHDYWLLLSACVLGNVSWLERPSVYYRQHGGNQVGAKRFSILRSLPRLRAEVVARQQQAAVLLVRYAERLSPTQREACEALAQGRRLAMWRAGVKKNTLLKNVGFYGLVR